MMDVYPFMSEEDHEGLYPSYDGMVTKFMGNFCMEKVWGCGE